MKKKLKVRFGPGQLVQHKEYGYRGVIYDVDERCKAEDQWYYGNRTQPNRNQPWYHVLVDESYQTTYVAQENLEEDCLKEPIDHPLVEQFFHCYEDGYYSREFDA